VAEIASAHVSIYPKFAEGAFKSGLKSQLATAGTQGGAQFNTGFNKAIGGKSGGLGAMAIGGLKAGLVGLAASASFGAISGGFASVTGAASDLSETVNKSKVIFGDNYAAMDAWASGAAKSMGLSKQAALESASGFGNMFTQLGFTGDAAANMSQQVMQMATDMGSFNNLPTAQVADMISAAFRGEYDSLQRLVPTINAAAVEQEAMAMTGKENAKELTQQEKAAATMALVTKGASVAMGDFANTADGMANKSKINAARIEELKASFGGLMGPIQKVTNEGFEQLIAAGEGFTAWLEKNPEVIEAFAAGLSLAGDALKGLGMLMAPVAAVLIEGFAGIMDAAAGFLDAIGKDEAAGKVRALADGAHTAAAGFEDLTNSLWKTGGASEEVTQAIWADVAFLVASINSSKATVTINGNPMPAEEIVKTVLANVDASSGMVTINGQAVPAAEALRTIIAAVDSGQGTITIGGNPDPAKTAADGAATYADGKTGTIDVNANASAANTAIDNAARTRTATINLNVTGTADAFRLLRSADGGLVPNFSPGFAAGGSVPGWSPHDRADNIPAWLTAREFVQPVAAVDHYGVAAMEAVRQRRAVISYSDGGLAGYRPAAATSGGQYGKLDEGALARALVDALSGAELRLTGAVDTIGDAVAGRILLAYEGAV
jgi:hypothetical protein